jgi:hypothetical protein
VAVVAQLAGEFDGRGAALEEEGALAVDLVERLRQGDLAVEPRMAAVAERRDRGVVALGLPVFAAVGSADRHGE